jgi:hypothetical protein
MAITGNSKKTSDVEKLKQPKSTRLTLSALSREEKPSAKFATGNTIQTRNRRKWDFCFWQVD